MSSSRAAKSSAIEVATAASAALLSAEVVNVAPDGRVFIDYLRNPLGPLAARTLVEQLTAGAKVLIAFDSGDRARPIVLGILHDRVQPSGRTLHWKAARIILEANDELLMRCGEASFAANRQGKVYVKGRDVTSRAARTNKVRGASVLIN